MTHVQKVIGAAILLAVALSCSGQARASSAAKEHAAPAAASAGHEEPAAEGTKNPFPVAFDLGIWTIVVFLLLLLILSKYAWGPMLEGLQKRENNIRSALVEAQKAREEAQALRKQFELQMEEANEKVRQIHEEARKKAEQARAAMLAETQAEIKTQKDRLYQELAIARDQAIAELWAQTATLATQVSAKALRRSIDSDDHRRLVEEALAEIKNAGLNRQQEFASSQL